MVYAWKPWTQYNSGSVVEYEGGLWQTIQGHQSEPNWQPPNVPALFSRVPEEEHDDYHSGRRHHGVQEDHHSQPPYQGGGSGYYPHQPAPGYGNPQQPTPGYGDPQQPWQQQPQPSFNQSEYQKPEEKNWLEEHKTEVGGGIVGAIAIGAGIWAYSHHKSKEEEEAKKRAWMESSDRDNWQRGADNRTQYYENGNGQRPPVYWVLVRNGLPPNAIVGGYEHGEPLYIARGFYHNALHPGKYSTRWKDASIAYGGGEHHVSDFEVLVGDPNAIRWIPTHGQTFVQGWTPVEGGREEDGTFLFVCRAQHKGGVHPGKVIEGKKHCNISWGGNEHLPEDYEVLAYAYA